MFKKVMVSVLALVFIGGMAFAGGRSDGFVLRVNTVLTEADPMFTGLTAFQQAVQERTQGNVQVHIFTSSQLGSDEDVIEQARVGANVGVMTEPGRLSAYVPDFAIFGAPYLITDFYEIDTLLATPAFNEMSERLLDHGLRVLSFNWFQGERHLFTQTPVSRPDDLRGVRIRSMGTPVANFTLEAMGGNPVALPWAETYQALATRAVDAVEVHFSAALGSSIHEVTGYLQRTSHFFLMSGMVISDRWFQSLPREYQIILQEEAHRAGQMYSRIIADNSAIFEQQLVANGLTLHPVDRQSFITATAGVYDRLGFGELRRRIDREMNR